MNHEQEIESIVAQLRPWPEEDRVALAYLILRDMRKKMRGPAPRRTLDRALGLARGTAPPPEDAMDRAWIEEYRGEKYG